MGGGASSEDATIGAAKARGEEIDDGVDERVGIFVSACQSVGVGALVGGSGKGCEGENNAGVGVGELVAEEESTGVMGSNTLEWLLLGAMECDEEAIGVGSNDGASPVIRYPDFVLERSSAGSSSTGRLSLSSLLSSLSSSPSSLASSCSTRSSHSCQIFSEYRIVFCIRTTLSIF